MKNLFVPFLISLLVNQLAFSQSNQTEKIRLQFKEVEFEKLHIHSDLRVPPTYPATSLYAFKGVKLENAEAKFIGEKLNSDEIDGIYATYRFKISEKLEGWIIRISLYEGVEHHIFQLVYDKLSKKIIESRQLAHNFGYEGGMGFRNSLIIDMNRDGKPDLLTYTWLQSSAYDERIDGLDYREEDSLVMSIWKNGKLVSQTISDSTLRKDLMGFFPDLGANSISFQLEDKLVGLLENEMEVEVSEFYNYKWGIVMGSDEYLEAANFEGEKAKKLLKSNNRYDFLLKSPKYFSKGNRFYTVLSSFKNKEDAEKALPIVQKLIRQDAYIINEKKWCPKFKYSRELCSCD